MIAVLSLMIAIVERTVGIMSLTIAVTYGMGPGRSDMSAFMSMKHAPIRQTNAAFPWMARPDSLIDGLVSFNPPVIHRRTPVNNKMSAPMSSNRMLSGLIPGSRSTPDSPRVLSNAGKLGHMVALSPPCASRGGNREPTRPRGVDALDAGRSSQRNLEGGH